MQTDLEQKKAAAGKAFGVLDKAAHTGWSESSMLILSMSLLVFALLLILVLAFMLFRSKGKPDLILPTFGIPLIIVTAAFLVITGYSQDQMNTAMGLLGTIAGYLLGRDRRQVDSSGHDSA